MTDPTTARPFGFSAFQVQRVCHYAPMQRIFGILLPLNECLPLGEITTPLRAAMFLAQLAHESAEFRYFEEIADGNAYDIRVNARLALKLGNVKAGDGPRFKGRGPMQVTGRKNYTRVSVALGVDVVANPQLLADPKWGFKASAFCWRHALDTHGVEHDLNVFADAGDVEGCTKIINGGSNGLDFRIGYYKRAIEAFGLERLGVA